MLQIITLKIVVRDGLPPHCIYPAFQISACVFEMAVRGYANKILLRDGGSITAAQAKEVEAKYGVFPQTRGIRRQNEAKKAGIEEWPTKAVHLSLDGTAANFDAAQAMVLDFIEKMDRTVLASQKQNRMNSACP